METVKPDSFTRFNFISKLELSSDNSHAAFLVKSAEENNDGYDSNIWLYNFNSSEVKQLTRSDEDTNFTWLDENTILFTSTRETTEDKEKEEEETVFYSIDVAGGEGKKEFTINKKVSEFRWVDETLVFKAPAEMDEESSNTEESDESEGSYKILDEIPFWENGKGFTNKKREHLFVFRPDDQGAIELTEGLVEVGEFAVGDGEVAFVGTKYKDKFSVTNDIYTVKLDNNSNPVKHTDSDRQFGLVEYYDQDQLFVTSTDMVSRGLNENHQLFRFDLAEDELYLLNKDWKGCIGNRVLTDVRLGGGQRSKVSEGTVYFITTDGSSSRLTAVDGTGEITYLTEPTGSTDSFDVNGERQVAVRLTEQQLQEVYTAEDESGSWNQITQLNEESLSEIPISDLEKFSVTTESGSIDAWIMRPQNYDVNKEYPTILEVHGGPEAAYGDVYFHEMQLLANSGYVLVFSNPRGSAGKGDEFADIRGKYGDPDYQDLMKVLDRAIEEYDCIDENRLGVTGGSYGGFMTNWIIGHTDRFDAAVSCRSISNWISKFNSTDIGYYFVADQQAGNPWDDHEELWRQSPLRYANRANTPTLFIHSDQDYRCWLGEGIQMFTALKYFGVDAKMVLFEGENHDLSRSGSPANRIKRLEEMVSWFNLYLKED